MLEINLRHPRKDYFSERNATMDTSVTVKNGQRATVKNKTRTRSKPAGSQKVVQKRDSANQVCAEKETMAEPPTGADSQMASTGLGSTITLSSDTEHSNRLDEVFNVILRVRPLNSQEKNRHDKFVLQFLREGQVTVSTPVVERSFHFDAVFDPSSSQEDLFEKCGIKRLIVAALNGYTCTTFAFGQTGSGKTHTMTGPPAQMADGCVHDTSVYGIIQRSFLFLFQEIQRQKSPKFIRASYLEIYNEQVIDLLNQNHRRHLSVRWSKNKGFYVENLFTVPCQTTDDLMAVLEEGTRNKQMGSHGLNENSSRSHSVLTITIDSDRRLDAQDDHLFVTNKGKLSFVDLAGSEKVKDTSSKGSGMVESNSINKSLLVLGNCISHLGDSRRRLGHIPYRDSKLTKLLADSLAGNSITLMIACVTPSAANVTETINTLRYASRAKRIKTKPTLTMDPRESFIVSLKREIRMLRQENQYFRQHLDIPSRPKGQHRRENSQQGLLLTQAQMQKESNLYQMLQEYLVENEELRAENSQLLTSKDSMRREQQILYRENETLSRRVEELERLVYQTPHNWPFHAVEPTAGFNHRDHLHALTRPLPGISQSSEGRTNAPVKRMKAGLSNFPVNSPGQTSMLPPSASWLQSASFAAKSTQPRDMAHKQTTLASPTKTGLPPSFNDKLMLEVMNLGGEIEQQRHLILSPYR